MHPEGHDCICANWASGWSASRRSFLTLLSSSTPGSSRRGRPLSRSLLLYARKLAYFSNLLGAPETKPPPDRAVLYCTSRRAA